MKAELSKKVVLDDKIVFLDGLTRAGKFMLGKVVSNYTDVEFFQYVSVFEHLPILDYHKLLDRNSAVSMMQLYMNQVIYERAIGRSLNCRPDDSSSILNATDNEIYFKRMEQPAYEAAVELFKKQGRVTTLLVHECLPLYDFFEAAFPKMQMISIQRHPVDIAHSWYKRGWGKRFGVDPLAFVPVINQDMNPTPWFATDWEPKYAQMSEVDRVVKSIVTLHHLDDLALKKNGHKKDALFTLSYEHIFADPWPVLKNISQFLGKEPLKNMDSILTREGIPAQKDLMEERITKFKELKEKTSPALFEQLVQTYKAYEIRWGLEKLPV